MFKKFSTKQELSVVAKLIRAILLDTSRRDIINPAHFLTLIREPAFVDELARKMEGNLRGEHSIAEIKKVLPKSNKILFDQLVDKFITFDQFKLRIHKNQRDKMLEEKNAKSNVREKFHTLLQKPDTSKRASDDYKCLDDLIDMNGSELYIVSEQKRKDLTKIMDMIYRKDSKGNYLVQDLVRDSKQWENNQR